MRIFPLDSRGSIVASNSSSITLSKSDEIDHEYLITIHHTGDDDGDDESCTEIKSLGQFCRICCRKPPLILWWTFLVKVHLRRKIRRSVAVPSRP